MEMNLDKYVTTFKVAEMLGISASHVRRLIRQGKIKASRLGNNWLIMPRDIVGVERERYPLIKKEVNENGNGE
jgi:excisionase family DNA binding protein